MPVHQLIFLIVGATILLIGGPWVGFLIARLRFRDQARVLDERERRFRAKQVEARRRFFQDSTALVNQKLGASIPVPDPAEKLERKELELSLLREEKDLEIQNLRKQIERLEKRYPVVPLVDSPDDFTYHKTPGPGIRPAVVVPSPKKASPKEVRATKPDSSKPIPVPGMESPSPKPVAATPVAKPAASVESSTPKPVSANPVAKPAAPAVPVPEAPKQAKRPSFQTLSKLISTSGSGDGGRPADGLPQGAAPPAGPHQPPVSESELALVRKIVHLPLSDFELLQDLGYATLAKLAHLSPGEIRRLTEIFGVPQEHIAGRWIPEARARLAEKQAEPIKR